VTEQIKYDVMRAGKDEYAKLTKKQRKDPMAGPMAATRGIFAVADRMFQDFIGSNVVIGREVSK